MEEGGNQIMKGLWTFFRYHGKVVDAFIPEEKNKSGKRFEFQDLRAGGKYRKGNYFNSNLDKNRDQINLGDFNNNGLRVNIKGNTRNVQGHVEYEQLWKLKKCLVGEVATFYEANSLADRIVRIGLGEISIVFSERVSWTKILGVPLYYWNYETFKRNLTKTTNYEKIEMLISIKQSMQIEEVITLDVVDISFLTSLRERGWSKVFRNNISNKEVRQEEVEEGVSELKLTMFGVLNEGDHDAGSNGNLIEREFGDSRGMDWARKDLVIMCLAFVIGLSGGSDAHEDMEDGKEEETFNKKISSMRDILYRMLTFKEKQKRDRIWRKKMGKVTSRKSDISNRRKVILREAKQTWKVGKKLGLSVRGNEVDETKLQVVFGDLITRNWGDDNFDFRYQTAVGHSGGLITIWDKEYFQMNKEYCVNQFVVVEGIWLDFNIVRNKSERSNYVGLLQGSKDFWSFIDKCKLVDLLLIGKNLTWYRLDKKKSRLDRFLVDEEWLEHSKGIFFVGKC
ncbi:hypothetical protein ES332_A08G122500v1 [Gossypium tomentosum]|uniref:DUF4283 domain-containing protein n=1 Tax=Gossypium tomentosum TaxID=34277 RepID=A0A5D2PDU6_GOSTO|nr:hypothetical protein ES332_A08G122500v1 [Gossypium tomentosum]